MRLVHSYLVCLVLGALSSLLFAQITAHRTRVSRYTKQHFSFYVQDRVWYGDRWDYYTWSIFDLNKDHITAPKNASDGRFRKPDEILMRIASDPTKHRLVRCNALPRWVRNDKIVLKNADARFHAYGWPLRCLQSSTNDSNTASLSVSVSNLFVYNFKKIGLPFELRAPTGIIATGLAVNTVVHGFGCFFVLVFLKKLRARVRKHGGLCPNCKYDLLHNFEAGCPECGWNILTQESAQENTTEHQPVVSV